MVKMSSWLVPSWFMTKKHLDFVLSRTHCFIIHKLNNYIKRTLWKTTYEFTNFENNYLGFSLFYLTTYMFVFCLVTLPTNGFIFFPSKIPSWWVPHFAEVYSNYFFFPLNSNLFPQERKKLKKMEAKKRRKKMKIMKNEI